jgi:hypothetical protein
LQLPFASTRLKLYDIDLGPLIFALTSTKTKVGTIPFQIVKFAPQIVYCIYPQPPSQEAACVQTSQRRPTEQAKLFQLGLSTTLFISFQKARKTAQLGSVWMNGAFGRICSALWSFSFDAMEGWRPWQGELP